MSAPAAYPENPVLVRVWRGGAVESVHRGAWCLVDPAGAVLAGQGAIEHPYPLRSTVKAVQALPLLESGAAERFALSDAELAQTIASHAGEPLHTACVAALLARLGLGVGDLRCGPHPPSDRGAREALRARGEAPSALHSNCSGKHAGFLALARHLDVPPAAYLEPESAGQRAVRRALAELGDTPEAALVPAIDGCSAPTYRMSLRGLATAFARLTDPAALAPARRAAAERLTGAAAAHPERIGASRGNLDTEILRASGGRLFPKIGAESMYVLGVRGGGRALALKIDDGQPRALPVLVHALLDALGLARPEELAHLASFGARPLTNFAGLETGRLEAVVEGAR